MSKKKNKKKNTNPPLPSIRLSQCMIVKNEEKNIERALKWAKNIAFEQIVVDTGSTDRTVEIARKMGAKVFHFEWIDDFSAAKNYAIEQASGNWIAFLDADEYFSSVDAKKLMIFLKRIQSDFAMRENYLALGCALVNVDGNGKPFQVIEQVRIFRNIPSIRYTSRIHERLDMDLNNMVKVDEIQIIHTGYAIEESKEKGKAEHNIRIIRKELAEKPDDLNLKVYLADSLKNTGNEDDKKEAESLFSEVLDKGIGAPVASILKRIVYAYFMKKYENDPSKSSELEKICRMGLEEYPGFIDYEYYLSCALNGRGEFSEAWRLLKSIEAKLSNESTTTDIGTIAADPTLLHPQMVYAAQGLGDIDNVIKYVTLILKADKKRPEVLLPYISTLQKNGSSTDGILEQLKTIYDFSDKSDLLLIEKAAKETGATELATRVMAIETPS